MREIKFRGIPIKKEDRDKFGYEVGKPIDKFIYGDLEIDYNYGGGTKYYISKEVFGSLAYRERIEVDPNTVGQFTGRKDKNGVKIYDGHIVRYTESYGCSDKKSEIFESVVKIHPTYVYPFSNVRDVEDCWYSVEHSEYEVVGNIHD